MKTLFRKLFVEHYNRLIAEGRDEIEAYELAADEAWAEVGQVYIDTEELQQEKDSTSPLTSWTNMLLSNSNTGDSL